jgi:hypothetical protein
MSQNKEFVTMGDGSKIGLPNDYND